MNAVAKNSAPTPIKLDIGCGSRKQSGHIGVDLIKFDGVDVVFDLRKSPWPWDDNSVDSAHCSHFLEHLTNQNKRWERVTFFNELWRVMKPEGQCTLIVPHWASNRFYGDPTHCEPLSEMAFYYLDPTWREREAPHTDARWNPQGYNCHWSCTWGYGMHPEILVRNAEYQRFAMTWYKEACVDMHCTMTAKKT